MHKNIALNQRHTVWSFPLGTSEGLSAPLQPKGPLPLPAGSLKFAYPNLSLHVKGSDPHWSTGTLVRETPSDLSYLQHGVQWVLDSVSGEEVRQGTGEGLDLAGIWGRWRAHGRERQPETGSPAGAMPPW